MNAAKTCEDWFDFRDVKRRNYETQVWIPLNAAYSRSKDGIDNRAGFREDFFLASSLAIPSDRKDEALEVDGGDVIDYSESSSPYIDGNEYVSSDVRRDVLDDVSGIRLVLEQRIPGTSLREWLLNQDFVLGLNLVREGDKWLRIEEGRVEVARLHRDGFGKPVMLEAKAEFLNDYLCARKMGLLLGTYCERVMISEARPDFTWMDGPNFANDDAAGWRWRGEIREWHEGGMPYGTTWNVFEMRRTDFDPDDEVPKLGIDGEVESRNWTTAPDPAPKVYRISGELWRAEWIPPSSKSPRVGREKVPSTSYFTVDGAGRRVSADDLDDGLQWLWFRPQIVNDALSHADANLEWYTAETGNLRFAPDQGVHFGLNELGNVNVLAVDIHRLPSWSQAKWAAHNIAPTGKVSAELVSVQVSTEVPQTRAPESLIATELFRLADRIRLRYEIELFRAPETAADLIRVAHRFRSVDRPGLLDLAKDLTRLFADRIDAVLLQKTARVKPPATEKPLGSLKALERTLATVIDANKARTLMGPLFGIYDLRLGSAHLAGNDIEEAIKLAGIDTSQPFIIQGRDMLIAFITTIAKIAEVFRNLPVVAELPMTQASSSGSVSLEP